MIRHVRMGVWTGFLGGMVTAVISALLDLAAGAGLDTSAAIGRRLGAEGAYAATLALLVLVPLLAVVVGLVLACLPPRGAGAAAGLAIGAAVGVLAGFGADRGIGPSALPAAGTGLAAGAVTGFLYSRYARTRLRAASPRPFARADRREV